MEPLSSELRPKLRSRARLQIDKLTGKPALLYPEGVLMLNPTGYAIISLCGGQLTFKEMVAGLAASYKVSEEQISSDVAEYLDRLRRLNLLELVTGTEAKK